MGWLGLYNFTVICWERLEIMSLVLFLFHGTFYPVYCLFQYVTQGIWNSNMQIMSKNNIFHTLLLTRTLNLGCGNLKVILKTKFLSHPFYNFVQLYPKAVFSFVGEEQRTGIANLWGAQLQCGVFIPQLSCQNNVGHSKQTILFKTARTKTRCH